MSSPSDKKRKKQKERVKTKNHDKLNHQNSQQISKEDRKFGKTQLFIVIILTIAGAAFVIFNSN